ncbi:MAG: DUF896 domain-containing protein [Oscillospiraceae bacterium]|nr:DUF896 domain-containing protein [Oscillospiraceae bacterium]
MDRKKIDRINALARKAKTEGLTAEETAERDALRREYVDSVVGSLKAQLDNTYIMDEKGNKKKLPKKKLQ